MWGHQHYDVTPDIVTPGKPVGNGHPLGVVINDAGDHGGLPAPDGVLLHLRGQQCLLGWPVSPCST